MENEVKEVLDEVVENEAVTTNRKPAKAAIIGIAAATVALLVAFRKKIGAKIDGRMVKRLTKKGYTIDSPVDLKAISDDELFEEVK